MRAFLKGALPLAREKKNTISWYALQIDETIFGIFDSFDGEEGRQVHLDGEIAQALMDRADDLLTEPPQIEHVEVLAAKQWFLESSVQGGRAALILRAYSEVGRAGRRPAAGRKHRDSVAFCAPTVGSLRHFLTPNRQPGHKKSP